MTVPVPCERPPRTFILADAAAVRLTYMQQPLLRSPIPGFQAEWGTSERVQRSGGPVRAQGCTLRGASWTVRRGLSVSNQYVD